MCNTHHTPLQVRRQTTVAGVPTQGVCTPSKLYPQNLELTQAVLNTAHHRGGGVGGMDPMVNTSGLTWQPRPGLYRVTRDTLGTRPMHMHRLHVTIQVQQHLACCCSKVQACLLYIHTLSYSPLPSQNWRLPMAHSVYVTMSHSVASEGASHKQNSA